MTRPVAIASLLALVVGVMLAAACGGGGASEAPPRAERVASTEGIPTGPAVTVPADYEAPRGHVPSTGAWLPANGQPSLVFVDAIW